MEPLKERLTLTKKVGAKYITGAFILATVGFYGCFSPSSSEEQRHTQTTNTPEAEPTMTKGVITKVEEVEKDSFKITDETLIENVDDSRVITSYMDGTVDTFTLAQIRATNAGENIHSDSGSSHSNSTTHHHHHHRSGISSMVSYGLMGYFLGRSMSSSPNPGVYKNTAAYNKSTTSGNTMRSTATGTRSSARPSNRTSTSKPASSTRTVKPSSTTRTKSTPSTRSYGG
ncbi:MAG: hypothetical protein ACPG5P_02305 [Saprospiraceae bacterium]